MDKILILDPGPVYQKISPPYMERIHLLSAELCGDIIIGTSYGNCPFPQIKTFNFHCFKISHSNPVFNNINAFIKIFLLILRLCRKNKYKAIISPNPLMTGLVALLTGRIFRIKTIIEVNGDFKEAFKYGSMGELTSSFSNRLKEFIAIKIISFCLTHCNQVRTLYKNQIQALNISPGKIKSEITFPDYVAISKFTSQPKTDQKFILLLGYPWFLKGADILINAFNKITSDFPDYSLRIHGWNPADNEYFENLAKSNNKILLGKALHYSEVVEVMSQCAIYVLASRTEAMGRVLIEAMASCKPIIASDVGGVSSIIKDNYNGLLFQKENVNQLAAKLHLLLSDADLRNQIAINGFNYANKELSEECYLCAYKNMINNL